MRGTSRKQWAARSVLVLLAIAYEVVPSVLINDWDWALVAPVTVACIALIVAVISGIVWLVETAAGDR